MSHGFYRYLLVACHCNTSAHSHGASQFLSLSNNVQCTLTSTDQPPPSPEQPIVDSHRPSAKTGPFDEKTASACAQLSDLQRCHSSLATSCGYLHACAATAGSDPSLAIVAHVALFKGCTTIMLIVLYRTNLICRKAPPSPWLT